MEKEFYFLITYFKASGKYYTTALVKWKIQEIQPGLCYSPDAVAKLRGLRDHGGPGAMPGLISDGWEGPILIEQATRHVESCQTSEDVDDFYPNGVPHLLLPRS